MPKVPSKSLVTTARGAGMVHQDGLNNAQSFNKEGYNTFDRSNIRLMTSRFADIVPYGSQIAVDGDVIRKRNAVDVSTYTMKSRMLTDVNINLDSFVVNLSAIMPNTWRLVIKQPLKGNDVSSSVYPFWNFRNFLYSVINFYDDVVGGNKTPLQVLKFIVAFDGICGHYGLLKHLGYSNPLADIADDLYEQMVTDLMAGAYAITFKDRDNNSFQFGTGVSLSGLMGLLDRFWKGEIDITNVGTFVPDITKYGPVSPTYLKAICQQVLSLDSTAVRTIDMRKVFAYQMTCAQFMTNSHIDDIYTGEMWLQNLSAYYLTYGSIPAFSLNGVYYNYDFCSNYMLDQVLNGFLDPDSDNDVDNWFIFASNIFALRSSLRESDYFTNTRLTRLAAVDTDIAVNANKVSVIDVNEKEWYQRFANAVNRGSQEINNYLFRMFGIQRERIEPQPNFVVHESFALGQAMTENTGSAQVSDPDSVTSRLGSAQSRFMYEIAIDEPEAVVISLMSCTARYVYPHAIDKTFDTQERFDMFQSLLQHVGDQNVMTHELDCNKPYGRSLGFQLRYAQYKNSISHAVGGFSRGVLPTWALLYPSVSITPAPVITDRFNLTNLTPEFIRNHNDEFDQFYNSLTGKCPSERFHFVVKVFNAVLNNSKQQAYPTLM